MATLAEIRAQYPQYNDLSDEALADGLYRKSYSDMPREQFNAKIGLGPNRFDTAFDASQDSQPLQAEMDSRHRDFSSAADAGNDPQVQAAYDRANPKNIALGDVGGEAAKNLLPSAKQFGADMLGIVTDPIGTAKNIGNVMVGVAEKAIPGEQSHEVYADAVGGYFADRYGGWENLKRTMATDPVGFLADASTILSGGSTLAARAPGVAGTVGRVAGTAGRAIDPINAVMKAPGAVAKGVGKVAGGVTGLTTGVGGKAVGTAARAGFEGGEAAKTFRDNMRGAAPMDDVIAKAKEGVQAIKAERQKAYTAGMGDLSKDSTVLDFTKIDDALNKTLLSRVFEGKKSGVRVTLEPSATEAAGEVAKVLDDWRKYPPEDFHTPEGFDALKQRIGDIVKAQKPGSSAERIATAAYNVVKDQVTKQAPGYAKTMKGYAEASDLIKEIEGTLSLGRKARVDTSLRKLQSVMRDNVNTNYGQRVKLVEMLEQNGATHLMEALAGQAMKSMEPRGMARVVAALTGGGGVAAALAMFSPQVLIAAIGSLATQSPRLVGEAAYATGKAAKGVRNVAKPLKPALRAGYETRAAGEKRPLEITVTRPANAH